MSYALVLVFEGIGEDQYWAVNECLGINRDGTGDWPEGLVAHTGGSTDTGFLVTEVWSSKDDHERFMAGRLGAALAAAGVPGPSQVIECDVVNHRVLA